MTDTRRTTTGRRVAPTETEAPAVNLPAMPSAERVQQELATAKNLDDFFGKEGIFARLFASTIEQMLEAELTAHLGYERYAADGRNSGNSRNGKRTRTLRTSAGDTTITVPRDRNGSFQSPLLEPYQTSTNELEDKIIALYGKGLSVRDIQARPSGKTKSMAPSRSIASSAQKHPRPSSVESNVYTASGADRRRSRQEITLGSG